MTTYNNRTTYEQNIIRKAYEFEVEAIKNGSSEPNPYTEVIKSMGLWEALNEAIEMAFQAKQKSAKALFFYCHKPRALMR